MAKRMPAWAWVLIIGFVFVASIPFIEEIFDFTISGTVETIIIISIPVLIAILAPTGVFSYLLWGKYRDKKILETGRPGKAKIISISESDKGTITANNQPLTKLELEIYDGNKPSYKIIKEMIIPRLDVPKFQSGEIIKVKIDQKDPKRIVFDLNKK